MEETDNTIYDAALSCAELRAVFELQQAQGRTLDELAAELKLLREIMEYALHVTPRDVERETDLYPISAWLTQRFQAMERKIEELQQARVEHEDAQFAMMHRIASETGAQTKATRSVSEQLGDHGGLLRRIAEELAKLFERRERSHGDDVKELLRSMLSQNEEEFQTITELIEERTKRGSDRFILIVLTLIALGNTAMLCLLFLGFRL